VINRNIMKRSLTLITIIILTLLTGGCATRDSELARRVRTPGYADSLDPEKLAKMKEWDERHEREEAERALQEKENEAAQPGGSKSAPGSEPAPEESPSDNMSEIPVEEEDDSIDYPEQYDAAVKRVKENTTLPDGTKIKFTGLPDIEDTDFCVMDIDSDGVRELMVRYAGSNISPGKEATNAEISYMKSHAPEDAFIGIYEYKPRTRSYVCELFTQRDSLFYDGGVVISNITNYQNLARGGKSYDIYLYSSESDTYEKIGSVDTWDGFEHPEDYDNNPFPAQYDLDEDKIVYSISFGEDYPGGFIYDYDTLGKFEDALMTGRINPSWAHR